jgi:hypothetical protein
VTVSAVGLPLDRARDGHEVFGMAGAVRAAMTGEYMVTGGFVVPADSHVYTLVRPGGTGLDGPLNTGS